MRAADPIYTASLMPSPIIVNTRVVEKCDDKAKSYPFPSQLKGTVPNAMYIFLKGTVHTSTPGDASPGGVWGGGSIAGGGVSPLTIRA